MSKTQPPVAPGQLEQLVEVIDSLRVPRVVIVRANQVTKHDIAPARGTVRVVVRRGRQRVSSADVRLVPLDAELEAVGRIVAPRDSLRTVTGEKGLALFTNLPVGRYAVMVDIGRWSVGCGIVEVGGDGRHKYDADLGECEVVIRTVDSVGTPLTHVQIGVASGQRWLGVRVRRLEAAESVDGVHVVPYVHPGVHTVYANSGQLHGSVRGVRVAKDAPTPTVRVELTPSKQR